jgi:glycosyltransferase involved in cell wall biosynthesis
MAPLVSVLLLTYNHEKHITEAINSLLAQKTDFNFEILIGDDCSTDGTAKKVKQFANEYPEKIKIVSSETNVGPLRNEKRLFETATGKYIAFLEGDDYWTDCLKLQKQVDFLENNPEYGLVHGDVNHLEESSQELTKAYNKTNNIIIPQGEIFNHLIIPSHIIKTMTVCFRKEIIENNFDYNLAINRGWQLTDLPLWLEISKNSKIHYFNEIFATYRLLPESASRSNVIDKKYNFNLSVFDVFDYYVEKYNCSKEINKAINDYKFRILIKFAFAYGDFSILKNLINKVKNNLSLKYKLQYFLLKNKGAFHIATKLYKKIKNEKK